MHPDSNDEYILKVVRALNEAISCHVEKLHQKQQTVLKFSVVIKTIYRMGTVRTHTSPESTLAVNSLPSATL